MKFLHLSDLHLGIRVNEFPMIEDQKKILNDIVEIAKEEKPQAVLLSGDIYDKSMASEAAVTLLDDFLYKLYSLEIPVLLISGNHDSADRLAFGSRLMGRSGIYISPAYTGAVNTVALQDEFGEVCFHLLPFVKPVQVRAVFGLSETPSYTEALRIVVENMKLSEGRNVLLTHQFVTGAETSDSEVSVGGTDNVDAAVFEAFDYVALGHIHKPQSITEKIRYCGTPLKYSFSEAEHQKSVTVVEMGKKGELKLRLIPLKPLHDMREIRGTYNELMDRRNYEGTAVDDYLRVVLTDENDVPEALGRLRNVYPNIMRLDYDNTRTRTAGFSGMIEEIEHKTGPELFKEFYEKVNGAPMTEMQENYTRDLFERLEVGK